MISAALSSLNRSVSSPGARMAYNVASASRSESAGAVCRFFSLLTAWIEACFVVPAILQPWKIVLNGSRHRNKEQADGNGGRETHSCTSLWRKCRTCHYRLE